MEDASNQDEAVDMEVDAPPVNDELVPSSGSSISAPERGSEGPNLPQTTFQHRDAIASTRQPDALLPTNEPSSQQVVQVRGRRNTSDESRAIVSQRALQSGADNRLVFRGGSSRPQFLSSVQPRLLPSSDDALRGRDLPRLTDGRSTPDMETNESGSPVANDDSDDGEPDSKRPRLDDYEIALTASEVPQSYAEAIASPEAAKWKEAMRREIRSHVQNHTWDMLTRPRGVKVIGNKWVYALKYDEHGNVTRYKARLVALRYLQTHGVDYTHTYSPVASMDTIRVFLAVCCQQHLLVRQFDIETAFLNGDLDETVYMEPPEGVKVGHGMVCLLRRSLYGLKQAAAVWFRTIRAVFTKLGFQQCRADLCLFVRHDRGDDGSAAPVFMVLYVDDLLIGAKTEKQIEAVRSALAEHFTVKSLGDVKFVLGMEVNYKMDEGELLLKQTQFILRLLERFGQEDANPVRNPLVLAQDLTPDDTHARMDSKTKYRELIGSMLHIANATRPDISVALSILSQYLDDPREMHWRAAIRVLRYLKGSAAVGIKFRSCSKPTCGLTTFSDANWGGDQATRRSTSGVLVMMCDGPVVYKSKRQVTVALSFAEVEYMALALTTQEVVWLRFLLQEMGVKVDGPTSIRADNKSAISIAVNHGYTPRAKHIDLRAHFVRDHVELRNIKLEYVAFEHQLADFLTKAMPTPRLLKLRASSGLVEDAS
ncbi:hypothetical protein V7S43_019066 [Phytophthora oleae]|uniref:Reverse transcriptase Ty1/copia-type domain-containing protein n=1 Tax=Phytophthora oleae TaxID=2107226 RepID=A0ABD3FFL5_9STRA